MIRLYKDHIGPNTKPNLDSEGRIRLDDLELDKSIQAEIDTAWPQIETDNFVSLTDYETYKRGFRQLFGFEVDGINYDNPVEVEADL